MPKTTLITNALLVNENQQIAADLLIRDGRIEKIAGQISAIDDKTQVIDAGGGWLLPGMIDDQVHFREPGLTRKGDIHSESRAAVAGGITSFMEMPNTDPQTTNKFRLEEKFDIAAGNSLANYSFYLGATNDNIDDIRRLDPQSACGIKIFMGASTGNMLVDDEQTLEKIFTEAPCIIATHCEDSPTIARNLEQAMQKWGRDIPIEQHPLIRSREACIKSTKLATRLANKHSAQLHILHISTQEEADSFSDAALADKNITAEACVHFLHFDDRDYSRLGDLIKCNPAIKTAADRAAIIEALRTGRIDVIATDHAPHTLAEKQSGDYFSAPAGLPLVQWAMPAALELVNRDGFSIEQIVNLTSHRVAERFQVKDRGYLREGYWADLQLVQQGDFPAIRREQVLSRCGWSPFEGMAFQHRIAATWINGAMLWDGEQIIEQHVGQRLQFNRE
ncbi:MAG: dihydroorotase [Proteobacteria bacterium]|nr:dihydroorotase [Pseudomonadota bacterium]